MSALCIKLNLILNLIIFLKKNTKECFEKKKPDYPFRDLDSGSNTDDDTPLIDPLLNNNLP